MLRECDANLSFQLFYFWNYQTPKWLEKPAYGFLFVCFCFFVITLLEVENPLLLWIFEVGRYNFNLDHTLAGSIFEGHGKGRIVLSLLGSLVVSRKINVTLVFEPVSSGIQHVAKNSWDMQSCELNRYWIFALSYGRHNHWISWATTCKPF